jgi:hypothetical protein
LNQQLRGRLVGGVIIFIGAALSASTQFKGLGLLAVLTVGPVVAVCGFLLYSASARKRLAKSGAGACLVTVAWFDRPEAASLVEGKLKNRWSPSFSGDVALSPTGIVWSPRRVARRAGMTDLSFPWRTVEVVELQRIPTFVPSAKLVLRIASKGRNLNMNLIRVSVSDVEQALVKCGVGSSDASNRQQSV